MLARLSKTLSTNLPTNIAIGGLSLLVLGAGGTGASLAAGKSPVPTPNTQSTTEQDDDASTASDADEAPEGTRPTDTHGYCVSQVAKAETTGDTNHGALVSAAAHACGKGAKATKADKDAEKAARKAARDAARDAEGSEDEKAAKRQDGKHGKAYGHQHGTGRPAEAPAQR